MKYNNVIPATFISRPNRFVAIVDAGSGHEIAHVKNTGRCRELLAKGCRVYLNVSPNSERKTKYDLIAVEKVLGNGKTLLINMDSQIPNDAAAEWLPKSGLFGKNALFKREVFYGRSRFDFAIADGGRNSFLEVKGVTLEQNGAALFPDAPTQRGVKHIEELCAAVKNGFGAYILFVVQMKGIKHFSPNEAMQPEFASALRKAAAAGVKLIAVDCRITPNSICIDSEIPIIL